MDICYSLMVKLPNQYLSNFLFGMKIVQTPEPQKNIKVT